MLLNPVADTPDPNEQSLLGILLAVVQIAVVLLPFKLFWAENKTTIQKHAELAREMSTRVRTGVSPYLRLP